MTTGHDLSTGHSLPSSQVPVLPTDFIDRRNPELQRQSTGLERRQFTNSMAGYTEEAATLGRAIDQYKLLHRRRFINFEELLSVVRSLGYTKN